MANLVQFFLKPVPKNREDYSLTNVWEVVNEQHGIIVWGSNKHAILRRAITEFPKYGSVSLRIMKANGQFQEERTYPRSADPKSSKG